MFAVGLLAATAAYGQDAAHPRFEVASIKPGGNVFSTKPDRLPGRIRWTTQVVYLIGYAHRLDFSRVSGLHNGSVYTVEATFDPRATDDQVRLMLQSLLTDRFKMRSHRVTVEHDGYALYLGKADFRIKQAPAAGEHTGVSGSDNGASRALAAGSYIAATMPVAGVIAITGRKASVSQLAETLQRVVGVPVWDRTGLTGNYDFAFRYAQGLSADIKTDAPALATALKENLGLTMKKQKGPLEALVVDYIEEPSAN
jgi:uncharacterized protein (TIGR03435 family)